MILKKNSGIKYLLYGAVICFILFLIVGGWFYYKGFSDTTKEKAEEYLSSTASVKSAFISSWFLKEENTIRPHFNGNPFYEKKRRKRDKPKPEVLENKLADVISTINPSSAALYSYERKLLVKTGTETALYPDELPASNEKNLFSIIRLKEKIFAEAVIPLQKVKNDLYRAGYVVIRISLDDKLFPELKSTPGYFSTEEIFISAPSIPGNGWMLNLTGNKFYSAGLPQSQNNSGSIFNSPAGKSIVNGTDQKGNTVAAASAGVKGFNWFVICKADLSEINEPVQAEGMKIIIFIAAVITLILLFSLYELNTHKKKKAAVEAASKKDEEKKNEPGKTEEEFDASVVQREYDIKGDKTDANTVTAPEPVVEVEASLPSPAELVVDETPPLITEQIAENVQAEIHPVAGNVAETAETENVVMEIIEELPPAEVQTETEPADEAVKEPEASSETKEVDQKIEKTEPVIAEAEITPQAEQIAIPAVIENQEGEPTDAQTEAPVQTPPEETFAVINNQEEKVIPDLDIPVVQENKPTVKELIADYPGPGKTKVPDERIEIPADTTKTIAPVIATVLESENSKPEFTEEAKEELPGVELIPGILPEAPAKSRATEYIKPGKEILIKLDRVKSFGLIPKIIYEINLLLRKEPDNSARLANLIVKEQSLTLKLLKIANSPYYGLKKTVTSIDYALLLLGREELIRLVTALSLSDAIRFPSTPSLRYLDYWYHSMAVGITARDIAEKLGFFDMVNEAFLGGIFHDLGIQILAKHFPGEFNLIINKIRDGKNALEAELEILDTTHQQIGRFAAEKWGLPEDIYDALCCHHYPLQSGNNEKLAGIINLADWLTHQVTKKQSFWEQGIELQDQVIKTLGFETVELRNAFLEAYYPVLHTTLGAIQF